MSADLPPPSHDVSSHVSTPGTTQGSSLAAWVAATWEAHIHVDGPAQPPSSANFIVPRHQSGTWNNGSIIQRLADGFSVHSPFVICILLLTVQVWSVLGVCWCGHQPAQSSGHSLQARHML